MRHLPILLLIVSLYTPLAQAADPPVATRLTSVAASIYVYWVPNIGGRPQTLGLSLLANEQDLGPLSSDECVHIVVPAGEVSLRLVRRPFKADEVSVPLNARLVPLSISTKENAVHYVEFRYLELVGRGEIGGFTVANVQFREVAPEVALPILNARVARRVEP